MKKLFAAILCVFFLLPASAAFAKEVPLPEANTDAEIFLPGFEWYCDYEALIRAAEENGVPTDLGSRTNMITDGVSIAPHWDIYKNDNSFVSHSEKHCGGNILFDRADFEIFGYSADQITMHIFVEPGFEISQYQESGAARLYLAEFWIYAKNAEEIYEDLLARLMEAYGENPIEDETGVCWINGEGAMLGASLKKVVGAPDYNRVRVTMMAPGAEDRLNKVAKVRNADGYEAAKAKMSDTRKLYALSNDFASAYFAGRADVIAGMLTDPYPYPRSLDYAGQASSFRLKGLEQVAYEEEIGTRRTIEAEFVNPQTKDSFIYLCMEFIKESDDPDGWKVQFFGIDA